MSISFSERGSFNRTEKWLKKLQRLDVRRQLNDAGRMGVAALRANTPVDTSETSNSWDYRIQATSRGLTMTWTNSHNDGGAPVAILLQYGHGTGTGGYVAGRDYINPSMKPIFDRIANDVWKVVTTV